MNLKAGRVGPRRFSPRALAERWLLAVWYKRHWSGYLLRPLEVLFRSMVAMRRSAYRAGWFAVERPPVPVIVVGNLSVGGTGKTPLTLWLVEWLRARGERPGIVTRGYGGRRCGQPLPVAEDADPRVVGDEAVLLARRCGCPVLAGRRRVEAVRRLVQEFGCSIVVSDDGLQHLALGRSLEIAVVDGLRRLGNGHCLPAGPLREPASRLRDVDLVVINGVPRAGEFGMRYRLGKARSFHSPPLERPLEHFAGERIHAVAGIGHPDRFFADLRALGLTLSEHPFPDHHGFRAEDLRFGDRSPVLMTEKDAVKCAPFADERCWYVPLRAEPEPALEQRLARLLAR